MEYRYGGRMGNESCKRYLSLKNLLRVSTDFIAQNPNAMSDEIPRELLDFWAFDGDLNQPIEEDDSWTVFLFALINYKKSQELDCFNISMEEMIKTFQDWQVLVNAALVSQRTNAKITPFPMFDFDNIEKIEFEVKFDQNGPFF